jgi:hypothetical protein
LPFVSFWEFRNHRSRKEIRFHHPEHQATLESRKHIRTSLVSVCECVQPSHGGQMKMAAARIKFCSGFRERETRRRRASAERRWERIHVFGGFG